MFHTNVILISVSIYLRAVTGTFDLEVGVDALFFIGSQLVALSHTGKVGVWNAMTQTWQVRLNH